MATADTQFPDDGDMLPSSARQMPDGVPSQTRSFNVVDESLVLLPPALPMPDWVPSQSHTVDVAKTDTPPLADNPLRSIPGMPLVNDEVPSPYPSYFPPDMPISGDIPSRTYAANMIDPNAQFVARTLLPYSPGGPLMGYNTPSHPFYSLPNNVDLIHQPPQPWPAMPIPNFGATQAHTINMAAPNVQLMADTPMPSPSGKPFMGGFPIAQSYFGLTPKGHHLSGPFPPPPLFPTSEGSPSQIYPMNIRTPNFQHMANPSMTFPPNSPSMSHIMPPHSSHAPQIQRHTPPGPSPSGYPPSGLNPTPQRNLSVRPPPPHGSFTLPVDPSKPRRPLLQRLTERPRPSPVYLWAISATSPKPADKDTPTIFKQKGYLVSPPGSRKPKPEKAKREYVRSRLRMGQNSEGPGEEGACVYLAERGAAMRKPRSPETGAVTPMEPSLPLGPPIPSRNPRGIHLGRPIKRQSTRLCSCTPKPETKCARHVHFVSPQPVKVTDPRAREGHLKKQRYQFFMWLNRLKVKQGAEMFGGLERFWRQLEETLVKLDGWANFRGTGGGRRRKG
ncbi:hypothetical protein P154DRAFT_572890 [Amniculicola lignicola CBS 123094]|uniref:Uncharacterized protein n=1 Tax=Amniculicola lignicola CBS 123094 TaxID=1392246 RepID=A0A6A5WPA3_9PLEO|nr:hypothetical protein P154DRAFT_572890 [Amniculicola lignicola CBS 123094]